ncbi:ABC transporter ATP-binding protein [Streptomyces alkaliphilus]|uniref:ABC transporter ATP-binding protein n=1 Tax=Streptomyces alkaliphilus TaxID=1472722 RepID=UPI003F679C1A
MTPAARTPATVPAGPVAVSVREVHKTYPGARRPGRRRRPLGDESTGPSGTGPVHASAGIDLEVGRGEIFGLLGPNGAGKTTLVRQLTGLLRPDSGSIELLGHDVVRYPRRAPRLLAHLGQDSTALDEFTVAVAAETTGVLRGLDRAEAQRETGEVLEELGLTALAARPLTRLSGGQRRLACVAAVLVGRRPLLILDEPTAGMDPVARRAVWAAVDRRRAEHGTTVVLVTHNVIEAETLLDRVAVLEAGRVIACDTPGGLKAMVGDEVRLDLVWRDRAPMDVPAVAALRRLVTGEPIDPAGSGRRWTLRLPPEEARAAVAAVTTGPAFAALDDFTLATPTLEDVYLALGGSGRGLVRS